MFWIDFQHLVDGIHIGKYERQEPHVIVSVMEIFKVEYGDRMNLLPLINVSQSGIRILFWLERLVNLLKAEGRNNLLQFYNKEGNMLSAISIESEFHPILGKIKEHRDKSLTDSIPKGLDAK